MFPRRLALVAALLSLVAGTCAEVCAQTARDPRAAAPYRGLFGGNNGPDENGQVLDFTAGLFGGYDNDLGGGESATVSDSSTRASSKYFGGQSQLRYRRNVFQKLGLEASAGTSSSLYTDIDNLVATSANGALGVSWSINQRTRMSLSQSVAYSPFYGYSLFPTAGVETPLVPTAPTFDTRVTKNENVTLGSSATFTREVTSRLSFDASANYSRIDFRGDIDQPGGAHYGGRAGFGYSLTRRARARLGYGYMTGDYGGSRSNNLQSHTIDVGIDYARALSFSRKTQLSFSTGSTVYSDARYTRYLVLGNAALTHQLGRTWLAQATYSRNLQLVNGFSEPFFADTASVGLGGFLGQRVRLTTQAGISWGQLGLSPKDADNRSSKTTYVSPALQVAITEFMALQGSYFYYQSEFDPGSAPLPEGLDATRSRQGVKVGLTFWVPLIR
ncbi:MAG: hypothetical protein JNM38_21580 [Acidobacteria bacterium]|nr:hypothetical protein [Acidobacteriota bacterium]